MRLGLEHITGKCLEFGKIRKKKEEEEERRRRRRRSVVAELKRERAV